MKKFTAVIVMTAMLCSLTACGHDTADEVTDESSVTSIEEVSEETTEEITEETTEETTEEIIEEVTETETEEVDEEDTNEEEISETEPETETENEPSAKISADGSYAETIQTYLECMNNHDAEGIMKISFPDKYVDTMYFVMESSGEPIEERMNNMAEEFHETVRLSKIISEETIKDDEIDMLREYYIACQLMTDYIEENGTENIDLEKTVDIESFPEPYFNLNDVRMVNCELEYEDENGDTYTEEQVFIVLYIDGEGWITDISMMDFVKESKQTTMDITASILIKAFNALFAELDNMGVELPEKCIICSDSSKNYNVSDEFLSYFEENLEHFFYNHKAFDYIIVIEDGFCVYIACIEPEIPKYVGTYPDNKLYSADGEPVTMDGKYTFDEIYNLCIDEIQK